MILADKIIRLRKRNGWSQEELAEKMSVSRQAVAKWEGAQTIPSLEKILQLGNLFGVTTDYLLKDEVEDEEFIEDNVESGIKHVTLTEANEFLEWRRSASVRIAVATFLCIFSVIPLFVLSAVSMYLPVNISENIAGFLGLTILLVLVAIAVSIFVFCGFRNAPYEFLDGESFDTEYGVKGMVKEKQKAYKGTYVLLNIVGVCVLIISPIPLFLCTLTENEFLMVIMLSVTIFLAGIGVMLLIISGVRWASMQKLLSEGDFTEDNKKKYKLKETISNIYWVIVVAVYLGWSFITNKWGETWIVWPIAGVLFGGVMCISNLIADKDK